jgi:aminopeptidase N
VIQIKRTFSFFIFHFSFLISLLSSCAAQPLSEKKNFTHQDTLRGAITPERAWWDVLQYDITVQPDYKAKTIKGSSRITCKIVNAGTRMQIDLQQPMQADSFIWNNQRLPAQRNGNVYYITFPQALPAGSRQQIDIIFSGKPREAVRAPWDGGWIWSKDKMGRPWMTVACQGLGASVWYPCKDHQSDEPDNGATLSITVPDSLVAVGNGRLQNKKANGNGTTCWTWKVVNPINNYTIIPYIGKYVTWHEDFPGEKGKLDCDYWVLDFEYWFGPYPFYEDGYKLVQSPHLGMEHQSAVAYGNGFQNGYLGRDLSGTGWGSKWDFIIVHESGHEWFANNITTNDIADMWVHEGFTNYSETIYTTCQFGVEAGNEYCIGTRQLIQNDIPVIGPYGVNQEGSGDMYYKGGNLLHTIRQCINNDSAFRTILRGLNSTFYHKTVTSAQIEAWISKQSGIDLSKVFDQYLRTTQIPVLEYEVKGQQVRYRFTNCIKGFTMPLKVTWGNMQQWIHPAEAWQTLTSQHAPGTFSVDKNFYIKTKA